jgi:cysteinyl-tRNA synthetase
MGRSLRNYYTLSDLMAKGYDPKALRYLLLSGHYRQQLNFTFEGLEAAKNAVDRLTNFTYRLLDVDGEGSSKEIEQLINRVKKGFADAMDDDLNIGPALAELFEFVREVNNLIGAGRLSKLEAKQVYDIMMGFDKVLAVMGPIKTEGKLPKEIEELILRREEARKAKNWKTADEIREQLKTMGVILEDTAQGVKWRMKKS